MAEEPEPMRVAIRPLGLVERRAVGGPVSPHLLAAYVAVALAAWLAATAAAVAAAGDLAAGRPLADAPVLAVHLLALGVLPFGVAGASFHLLPVMLRTDLPSQRALRAALPLLLGGVLVASRLTAETHALVWLGAGFLTAGLAIVLGSVLALVARAPGGRTLIASRIGISLSCAHVVAALALGAVVYDEDGAFGGLGYTRWLLIHLHVALIGWVALLIVTVGRNLVPMLARAPAAGPRRRPLDELALVGALWLLLVGIGLRDRPLTLAGAAAVVAVLGRFAALTARTALRRRGPIEAPLAHVLAGGVFLSQAAAFGLVAAAGAGGTRLAMAYVVLLLAGWAGGVVVGHVGKLLSLSLWVWWPPGPRPSQADLYPRRLGLVEAAAFAAGVELLALGTLVGSPAVARAGAAALLGSAVLAAAGAAVTWRRRARPQ